VEGVVWADRAWPLGVGGMLRYRASPVGPYAEVWATPGIRVGRHGPELTIPFMAVDSLASLRGGRANWGLPKTLATFNSAPLAARACLEAVTRGARLPLEEGLRLEAELFGRLFATGDVREGTRAFLEKRKPDFKGK